MSLLPMGKRIRLFRPVGALGLLVASLILVWGCKSDFDTSDAGAKREECTQRFSACNIECHKADALKECPDCCRANADSCDLGGSYSFSSCRNLD
jgi:hypothetical protein